MLDAGEQSNSSNWPRQVLTLVGIAAVGTGIFGITFGSLWAPTALGLFAGIEKLEFVVPFMPIVLIAVGASLAVKARQ